VNVLAIKPDEPGFDLAIGVSCASIFVVAALLYWVARQIEKRVRREKRGFEVKTNAGEEPVIKKEREHDHG
jgi:hypothetical protein